MSDEEWAFVAPYLTLVTIGAPQRVYELRDVFNFLASPILLRLPHISKQASAASQKSFSRTLVCLSQWRESHSSLLTSSPP